MFKVLICFFIAVASARDFDLVVPPAEVITKLMEIGQTCITESGAEKSTFEKLIVGSYNDDLATKKFIYCFLEKNNFIDSDGFLIKDNVLTVIGDYQKANKLGETTVLCNEEAKAMDFQNKYEKTFSVINCLHKNTPVKLKLTFDKAF